MSNPINPTIIVPKNIKPNITTTKPCNKIEGTVSDKVANGLMVIILVTLLIESQIISNVSSIVKIIDQPLYMRIFIIEKCNLYFAIIVLF